MRTLNPQQHLITTRLSTHPYTAVKIELVPSGIQTLNITAKKSFTIPGQNGGSVTIEAGERFTVVRSASLGADMWYIVRHVPGVKRCSCPATKPCKHEKAMTITNIRKPLVHKIVEVRVDTRQDHRLQEIAVPQFKNEIGQWTDFVQKDGHAKSFLATASAQALAFAEQQVGRLLRKPEPLFRNSDESPQPLPHRATEPVEAHQAEDPCQTPPTEAEPPTAALEPKRLPDHEPATEEQKRAILALCKRKKLELPCDLDTVTKYAAIVYLKDLQKRQITPKHGHLALADTDPTISQHRDTTLNDQSVRAAFWANLPSRQALHA
jgi:hypothetical protein